MARIAGVNIPQNKLVHIGLTYIYGIGDKFSRQICKDLDIAKPTRVNQLTDDQILKITYLVLIQAAVLVLAEMIADVMVKLVLCTILTTIHLHKTQELHHK